MKKDISLFTFEIRNRDLVNSNQLCEKKDLPWEFFELGVNSIKAFNMFFRERVVQYGAQDIDKYVHTLGLEFYDFEEMVKRNNGWNHTGFYWVKFENMGAKCFKELYEQEYPIYS